MLKNHFRCTFMILVTASSSALMAQNMAINQSGNPGNAAAVLDMSDATNAHSGVLMPNVSLISTSDITTIPSPPDGLMVYNTNPSVTFGVGFYYWSSTASKWLFLSSTAATTADNGLNMSTITNVELGGALTQTSTSIPMAGNTLTIDGGTLNLNNSSGGITNIGTGGTGNVSIGNNSTSTNAVTIDAGNNGTIAIGNSTSAHTIKIGNGGTAAQAITIGSSSSASPITLSSGTGGIAASATNTSGNGLAFTNSTSGTSPVGISSTVSGASATSNTASSFSASGAPVGKNYGVVVPSGSVGIGTATPNASALLDLTSTTSGVLLPRLTAAQILAITSPAIGLIVYNTDNKCFEFNSDGTVTGWNSISCACTGVPANAGAITPLAVCQSATNQTFTVPSVTGATYYTWAAPSQVVSFTGQGAPTITVSSFSTGGAGTFTVTPRNACGQSISGSATTVTIVPSGLKYVPITITNSSSTATSANFQQMVTVNSSLYASSGENATLNNVEFSTVAPMGATGATAVYAWIETGATSASTSTIYWVNLGTTTIPAGGSITLYLNFMSTTVMTSTTSFTGEAPNLSGTFGQFDNGALVFTQYGGNSWASFTTHGGTWIKNNGAPMQQTATTGTSTAGGCCALIQTTTYANSSAFVLGMAFLYTNQANARVGIITDATLTGTDAYGFRFIGEQTSNGAGFISWLNDQINWNANNTYAGSVSTPYTMIITDAGNNWSGSLYSGYGNEASTALTILAATPYTIGNDFGATAGYLGISAAYNNASNAVTPNPMTIQWFYMRAYPPSGVMPTVSIGTFVSC